MEYISSYWFRLKKLQRGFSHSESVIRDVPGKAPSHTPGVSPIGHRHKLTTPQLTSQLAVYIASSRAPNNPARHFASSISFHGSKMFFTGTLQEALASAVQSNKAVLCFVTGG